MKPLFEPYHFEPDLDQDHVMGPYERVAYQYAIEMHKKVNHNYGKHPYEYHLTMVRNFALKYINYVEPKDRDLVLAACWVHDIIEDCRETYNDVKTKCGQEVADLAYALTNEKGRNRAERANNKYYKEMRRVKYGTFVKLCDRLANTYNSIFVEKSSMGKKYHKEYSKFKLMVSQPKNKTLEFIYQWNFFRWNLYFQKFYRNLYNNRILYPKMWEDLANMGNEMVWQNANRNNRDRYHRLKKVIDQKTRRIYG